MPTTNEMIDFCEEMAAYDCFSNEQFARREMFYAISDELKKALREPKRPHGEWIPVTYRPMDEEEYEEYRKEFGEIPIEHRTMFSCLMPLDDQDILICTSWGGVSQDRCVIDDYGYALETQGDWDGVIAWMPLPEPYKEEGDEDG